MTSRTKATVEAIDNAITQLLALGESPTCERVRQLIGGGSYSTITGLLRQRRAARDHVAPASEAPDQIKAMGADLVARIYAHCHATATEMAASARRQAEAMVAEAIAERDASDAEVAKLENVEKSLKKKLRQAERACNEHLGRAARAEALVEERATVIARLTADVEHARQAQRDIRAELDRLRGAQSSSKTAAS